MDKFILKVNQCHVCPQVCCCKNCRKLHELKQHSFDETCGICMYGNSHISNVISQSTAEHIIKCHIPLHCKCCKKVYNTWQELLISEKKCKCISDRMMAKNDSPHATASNNKPLTSTPMQNVTQESNNLISSLSESAFSIDALQQSPAEEQNRSSETSKSNRRVTFSETPVDLIASGKNSQQQNDGKMRRSILRKNAQDILVQRQNENRDAPADEEGQMNKKRTFGNSNDASMDMDLRIDKSDAFWSSAVNESLDEYDENLTSSYVTSKEEEIETNAEELSMDSIELKLSGNTETPLNLEHNNSVSVETNTESDQKIFEIGCNVQENGTAIDGKEITAELKKETRSEDETSTTEEEKICDNEESQSKTEPSNNCPDKEPENLTHSMPRDGFTFMSMMMSPVNQMKEEFSVDYSPIMQIDSSHVANEKPALENSTNPSAPSIETGISMERENLLNIQIERVSPVAAEADEDNLGENFWSKMQRVIQSVLKTVTSKGGASNVIYATPQLAFSPKCSSSSSKKRCSTSPGKVPIPKRRRLLVLESPLRTPPLRRPYKIRGRRTIHPLTPRVHRKPKKVDKSTQTSPQLSCRCN